MLVTLKAILPDIISEVYGFGLKKTPSQFEKLISNRVDISNLQSAVYGYLTVKQIASSLQQCTTGDLACFRTQMLKNPPNPDFSFLGFDADRIARWDLVVWRYDRGLLRE